jgi:hypothetical protein
MNSLTLFRRGMSSAIKHVPPRNLLLAAVFLFSIPDSYAANRYWIATATGMWSNALNWSAASGGTGGAGVPGVNDRAYFNNGGTGNCTIDMPVSISRLNVASAYTGTISQGVNSIIVSGAVNFGGGIFDGGSADIMFMGNFTNSGTLFTSTSGVLEFENNVTLSGGTFAHHNGTVRFNSITGNIPLAGNSPAFYILELVGNGNNYNFNSTGNITVSRALNISGTLFCRINTGVFDVTGDINISNTATGTAGSARINLDGSGNQTIASTVAAGMGVLPNISIQKISGTLVLSGIISVGRDWTYVSGAVDAVSNSSTVVFGGNSLDITGSGMSFYHVTIASNTISLLNDLTVSGNLTLSGGTLKPGANTINLAGNWNNSGGAFTEATSVVNLNGTGLQSITSAGENFYDLTSDNTGSGIRLTDALVVRNTLTMNQGNIDLNGQAMTLGTSGANRGALVHNNGSMINAGSFTRWFNSSTIADGSVSGLFPIGTATDYRPFSVSAPVTKPSSGGTITLSYTDAAGNMALSIPDGAFTVHIRKNLNWSVSTGNGLAGGSYNLDVQGTGFGQIGNLNDLRLTLAGSVVGSAGANAGTTANPQINRNGLSLTNLNSTFYIGSVDPVGTTLPVSLISFTATGLGNRVRLDWVTSSEINSDHFTVQRSADAKDWEEILRVNAAVNSNTDSHYTGYDETPLHGTAYYRLKQTDRNGRETFSEIRKTETSESPDIKIYPNPATDYIHVSVPGAAKLWIGLFNINGQKINVPVHYQENNASVSVSGIPAGVYLIRISRATSVETRKLLIRR